MIWVYLTNFTTGWLKYCLNDRNLTKPDFYMNSRFYRVSHLVTPVISAAKKSGSEFQKVKPVANTLYCSLDFCPADLPTKYLLKERAQGFDPIALIVPLCLLLVQMLRLPSSTCPNWSRKCSDTRQSLTPVVDHTTSSRRIHDGCVLPYTACRLYGPLLEHKLQNFSIVMCTEYGVELLMGWFSLNPLFALAGVDDMVNWDWGPRSTPWYKSEAEDSRATTS